MRERFDASTPRRRTGYRSSTDGRRRRRLVGVPRASSIRARCRSKVISERYLIVSGKSDLGGMS